MFFCVLLSPKLIWDSISHTDNIILYTDLCSIITFKNSIPEFKKLKQRTTAVLNHFVFHDTFRVKGPGKVAVFQSHISMFHFESISFNSVNVKTAYPSNPSN